MATIYIFRHGQTEFNRDKRFTGDAESKLTPIGIQQARWVGKLLQFKKIQIAYHTHLSRSIDTLFEITRWHPECQQNIVDDRIIERSYGELQTLYHTDVIKFYGLEQYKKWHRGWDEKAPKGESFADVEVRVTSFIKDLHDKYHDKNVGIAISAHGNSIRLFRKILEKSTVEQSTSWVIPFDQYFEYGI